MLTGQWGLGLAVILEVNVLFFELLIKFPVWRKGGRNWDPSEEQEDQKPCLLQSQAKLRNGRHGGSRTLRIDVYHKQKQLWNGYGIGEHLGISVLRIRLEWLWGLLTELEDSSPLLSVRETRNQGNDCKPPCQKLWEIFMTFTFPNLTLLFLNLLHYKTAHVQAAELLFNEA